MGTERHLLCIEDPFELSHDLGRTVHAGECTGQRQRCGLLTTLENWVCARLDLQSRRAAAAAGRQAGSELGGCWAQTRNPNCCCLLCCRGL